MRLTGKSLEDFNKWLCNNHTPLWRVFSEEWITDSMRYGVLVDWFDSVNISIGKIGRGYNCFYHEWRGVMQQSKTRTQARQKAIERANIIYNENNN